MSNKEIMTSISQLRLLKHLPLLFKLTLAFCHSLDLCVVSRLCLGVQIPCAEIVVARGVHSVPAKRADLTLIIINF